jgi:16S rRNA (adenine1518-N6/adenine1519-N6)-dimethyltransferase
MHGEMIIFAFMGYILKKSLGQHFLRDEAVCRKIIDALQQYPVRQLLEVGPGGGALTKYLVELSGIDLQAVEIDEEKVAFLLKKYPLLQGKLIHTDFLEMEKPFEGRFTVLGNFPYNISSQILFRILDWKEDIECMVGMFQKEVAQRVASLAGSKIYGVPSVLVQAFFSVEYLFEIDEQSFIPAPKVKSAVIRLRPRTEPLEIFSEKRLFLLVKTAFNQRRKTLRNAVRNLFDPGMLEKEIFNRRAEQLSVDDFAGLTFMMK